VTQKTTETDVVLEIGDHLVTVRNLFLTVYNQMVKGSERIYEMPFSSSQLKALSAFHEDRKYSMSELSKNALVTMPSMTEMVDRLEAEDILERIRDTEDRRVVKVCLTEKGKKIHKELIEKRHKELHNMFGKLAVDERVELGAALERVAQLLTKVLK